MVRFGHERVFWVLATILSGLGNVAAPFKPLSLHCLHEKYLRH